MTNELYQVSLTVNILAKSPEEAKERIQKSLSRGGHVGLAVTCNKFQEARESAFGLKIRQKAAHPMGADWDRVLGWK